MSGTNQSEQPMRQGFLPTFSLRWFSFLFTLSILFAWIVRQAIIGQLWASAIVVTVTSVAGLFAIYAATFMVIWLPARMAGGFETEVPQGSPFAEGQLPPQVLSPKKQDSAN